MSKLGPEASELVLAGRDGLRPSDEDRARVLEALRARIAAEPGGAPGVASPGAGGLGWPLASGLLVGAALVGALLWQWAVPTPPEPSRLRPALSLSALASRVVPPAAPPVALPVPSASASASAAPALDGARFVPARAAASGLAEEVALLSRAETELHAGRFAKALRLLDDYERRFPKGALLQEDVAARVQALCGLGQVPAAKAQLKRLSPGSPHARRARAACGAERLD